MPLTNTATRYGSVTKTFHWLIALGILIMIPLGVIAHDAPFATADQLAYKATLFSIHKTLGVAIFFIALARIVWAISQPKPTPMHPDRKAETFAAEVVHWLLYGSLVMVPLSGWSEHAATDGFAPIWWPFGQNLFFVPKSPALAELLATVHYLLAWVLVGSIVLHVVGALKHHVIDKDATLRRMWFGQTEAGGASASHSLMAPVAAIAIWAVVLGGGWTLGMFTQEPEPQAEALADVESDWQVTEGTLGLSVQQFGKTVSGSFADWTAQIDFDDSDGSGEKGDVTVTVSIPSLTLGSVTTQALGADFLAAETHPTATFTAPILRTEDGYVSEGTLTLKGAKVPVTLPFTLDLNGDTATIQGQTTLDRRSFGVGDSMNDAEQLGFDVVIDVALTATRATD
ncbi:cytochrome b561/polyisoprenoid-binding protein YceI [Sagittula marina]|uniref:Cytochrome b561/polyisoprenoid-binding protein YceI n=1 Tax=Sagittula marina TaxID=943940 RepID=A0A7W6GS56_9RHOB|nr:cytochrome b/b6 domain-containing protein [Sagittula marina]MBB3985595.1 cytochrome b561/polyisoprenoid-binding protein YceI [Sagittula marina]